MPSKIRHFQAYTDTTGPDLPAYPHSLGPVVQSIVSLTSSLVVKMLTVLVSTISNSQVFLQKKISVAFANAKATHIFFSAKILAYMPYLMIKVLTLVLNNWALILKESLDTVECFKQMS